MRGNWSYLCNTGEHEECTASVPSPLVALFLPPELRDKRCECPHHMGDDMVRMAQLADLLRVHELIVAEAAADEDPYPQGPMCAGVYQLADPGCGHVSCMSILYREPPE